MIELCTSDPNVDKIRNEDDDSVKQEIHLVDNMPVIETSILGFIQKHFGLSANTSFGGPKRVNSPFKAQTTY